jgi:hypothetical protein
MRDGYTVSGAKRPRPNRACLQTRP